VRDNKNIDRIFQENLKDFEVYPPNKIWNTIEKHLDSTPKKRKVPIWIKISSIAALLLLFFSVGTIYFLPENDFTGKLIQKVQRNTDPEKQDNSDKNLTTETQTKSDLSTTSLQNSKENKSTTPQIIPSNSQKIASDLALETSSEENNTVPKSINNIVPNKEFSLSQDLANNNSKSIKSNLESRFSVATIFAPIYLSSIGDGSGIDSQFKDNPLSGTSSYSYGVRFAYQLNEKFAVQSGVNLINLGYKTRDIYVTPGVAVVSFSNLSNNPLTAKNPSASTIKGIASEENAGSLNQVFGYIEIPVELKYNVSDGKLGINVVGGFSTLLLNRDEVFVETGSFSQSLGSSNTLRSVNFSGNIGFDVDYSIKKNLYLNVSPMIKVQANTFSKNTGSIQPYYLGVYTGLNYKF
jgi:hypothetical protein